MKYTKFNEYNISRIIKGNWQLSGGHGEIDFKDAVNDLFVHVENGINVFDVGDIYTNAEEIMGIFLKKYKQRFGLAEFNKLRVHTKFVPDLNVLENLNSKQIETIIYRSAKRLNLDSVHLVQFHWWDFKLGNFKEAAIHLKRLTEKGLIECLGVTNFDVANLKELIDIGVPIKSNQVQFSLIDPRPLNGMLEFAIQNNISIFCYGVLAGGLLSRLIPEIDNENRSHIKYNLVIGEAGIKYYKSILNIIYNMSNKYHTSMANIATKFILDTPGISCVILGPRNTKHIREINTVWDIELTDIDYKKLFQELVELKKNIIGDIYSYERDISGPHGKIMKYNLNNMSSQG